MRPSNTLIIELGLVVAIAAACFALGIDLMSANFTFPYFSDAGSLFAKDEVLIAKSEYLAFNNLSNLERVWFDFSTNHDPKDLVAYKFLVAGFLQVTIIAKLLLPFLPPIVALVVLQLVIHCIICISVLRKFPNIYLKLAFITLYALNPVVLKFVCFSFYYFWQVIPSFFLVLYLLDKKCWGAYLLPVALVLGFSLGIRGTMLLVVLAFLFLTVWREKSAISLVSIAVVFGVKGFFYSGDSVPWHTMYLGIGAYANPYGVVLDDRAGFDLFEEKTKIVMDQSAIFGNFFNPEIRGHYFDTVKEEYLTILKESPLLLFRNAIKNTLGGYSFGFFIGNSFIQWLAVISGGSFGLVLLLLRQYVWFLAIGLSLVTFTSFYPPIPAYMYGSYLIIVVALLQVLSLLHGRIEKAVFSFRTKPQSF